MKNKYLRRYLLAGIVVWVPIIVTFALIRFFVDLLDTTISLLPAAYQPQQLIGINLPGLGVVISMILLLLTGFLATNFMGQHLVAWSESLLDRIPLVRTIYNGTKQILQAILATNSQAFRKVLLVEYPRKGLWSLAFQTGVANSKIKQAMNDEMVCVFIPTTPNPTSGFLMMIPKSDVCEVDMTIDEALKFIISLGVMQPGTSPKIKSRQEKKL